MSSTDFLSTSSSCCRVIATGFSCEYPWAPISCPADAIIFVSSGKVSIEWPGINQLALILNLSNSFSSLGVPTSPANTPR